MAPEVLRDEPYTPASDIYSFAIIMWEFTSGIPPFNKRAHDHQLSLSICKGERPEIIKNTPKCYIELMEKCWDTVPLKRPTIKDLEDIISQWLRCINKHYKINNENDEYIITEVSDIDIQSRSDMNEFVKANKSNESSTQEQNNNSHPQASYTSRLLTEIIEKTSEGLDCII
ncbi:kinase-like domain-containing protein [Glomus cerebriforme]|uniref:Kinase-like domain-containing protein n=1 Tax=Glomus cerebriforme TaxID=658196 RepID=A0A397T6D6_9GLOM|nr:kinase-like domain-containing protein [Glomus cerebriforme]